MTDMECRLREAMHAAVDDAQTQSDLVAAVLRRHRQHLARVVGLVAVGAIAVAAVPVSVALRGAGHGRPRSVVTVPASSPTPARSSGSPSPRRSSPPARARRHRSPAWLRGLPLPTTTSLRLLVDGRDPAWFSTLTGVLTPVAGLAPSRFPYVLGRLSGGWVAAPSPKGPACEPQCPGPELPVYYIADGSATARRIGTNAEAAIVPGTGQGTLWLSRYPKGTTDTTTAAVTSQEFSRSGRAIGSPVRLPAGFGIYAQVRRYLLLAPNSQGPGRVVYKLWDPSTRRAVRTFTGVIGASASQVVWDVCGGCAVRVLDLRTGSVSAIGVPTRTWAYDGTFSSDERFLAVHLSGGVRPDGYATLQSIAVIDLRTRQIRLLVGSALGTNRASSVFGWQGGTDTLVAAVPGPHSVSQIGIWRPGATQLLVRRIWLPPGMTFAVGPFG
jgi:hypothetical protein